MGVDIHDDEGTNAVKQLDDRETHETAVAALVEKGIELTHRARLVATNPQNAFFERMLLETASSVEFWSSLVRKHREKMSTPSSDEVGHG